MLDHRKHLKVRLFLSPLPSELLVDVAEPHPDKSTTADNKTPVLFINAVFPTVSSLNPLSLYNRKGTQYIHKREHCAPSVYLISF